MLSGVPGIERRKRISKNETSTQKGACVMPIPKEILAVNRPKNTVVIAYSKHKNMYGVRKRIGCTYDKGRRLPVNGPIIGHIVDFQYVPVEDAVPETTCTDRFISGDAAEEGTYHCLENPQKRKPGRPRGSKSKKKETAGGETPKRKRGRPKGSSHK